MDDQKRAAESDRIRAIGILFLEQMREWIPYLLSVKDPSGRLELDAWSGKRRRGQHLQHSLYIDAEVEVLLPQEWLMESAREKVDIHFGTVGVYDSLAYNPNDPTRIDLPWTEKEVIAMSVTL